MRRLNPASAKRGTKGATAPARRPRNRKSNGPIRRKPVPRWQLALLRIGGPVAAIALVSAGLGWLWQSGWIDRQWSAAVASAVAASGEAGFAVREVLVKGREETSSEALMEALQIRLDQPILSVSPEAIKARVEALPWVRSASVERRLPDTLYLRIEEHKPMALWQRSGKLVLVSRSGEVIADPRIGRFAKLPIIVGDEAPARAPELLDMLALAPTLSRRVTAAVLVSGRRWNLRLDNGIDVKLPEEGGDRAWLKLARLDRKHGLLARDLEAIDLRVPDRLVVRLSPDAMARYRAPAKNT